MLSPSPPLPPRAGRQIAGETVSLVVPCADMANHVLSPNAGYRFVPEADAFQLHALQVSRAGAGPGWGGCGAARPCNDAAQRSTPTG